MRVASYVASCVAGLTLACAPTQASKKEADAPPKAAASSDEPAGQPAPAAPKVTPAEAFRSAVTKIEPDKSGAVDWDDVASSMKRLTKQHPSLAVAWYNLGVAKERQGRADEAEDAYRRAMQKDATLGEAHVNLASLLLRRGEHRQAVALLRELVERDPGAARARVALAQSLLNHGQPEDAVRLAQEALSREPKIMDAYCVLTEAAVQSRDHQRVRLLVAQGMKIDAGPASACLHFALAKMHLEDKELAKALLELRNVVAKDGGKILEARFRIAEISMGFKDFRTAVVSYESVTKIDPSNVRAWVNLGVAHKGGGQYAEAEKAYKRAIEVGGDNVPPQAHFNLGVLYLRNLDRIDDARAQLKRYLAVGNVGANDPAFAWLEEIDQRKAMEEEMRRMEEEERKRSEAGDPTPPVASE